MSSTRRDFLAAVSAAALAAPSGRRMKMALGDDPLGVRSDFPVVGETIYLDSAYITPSPAPVVAAATRFLQAKAVRPVSLGEMMAAADQVRQGFAALIGARKPEIGLLFATSDGENLVAQALELGPGDNVVIDDLHYETTFVLYRHLEATRGVQLRIVPNVGGAAPAEAFEPYVDERTRLVSVAWVSHQNGYRHDLAALARLAHRHGAYLYADAIQGIGTVALDVGAVGVDFLTAGTYKWLLGGYGVAPFYVRAEHMAMIPIDRMGSLHIAEELGGFRYRLYEDGRKYTYATLAFGAVFQLRAALEYLRRVGVPHIEQHTVGLAHRLREGLIERGFRVDTPAGNHSPIVTFTHGVDSVHARRDLQAAHIKVSFKHEATKLRVAPALFNNAAEIDRLLEVAGAWV